MEFLDRVSTSLNYITSYWQIIPPFRDPKRVLLLLVHPCGGESFNGACANAVLKGLKNAGHQVRYKTLYGAQEIKESDFGPALVLSPALPANEKNSYSKVVQNNQQLDPAVHEVICDLKWAQAIVFVYPTWWMNVPATLKGLFERCFLPHVAFDVDSNGLIPLLTNIEKVGVVTTYGASPLIVFCAGDNGRRMISNAIRPLFHPTCTLNWTGLYNIDTTTFQDRNDFLIKVEATYKQF